jgi:hypothetical protein
MLAWVNYRQRNEYEYALQCIHHQSNYYHNSHYHDEQSQH